MRDKAFKLINKMAENKLVAGSLVMFVGATIFNIGNYLFHLLMGRMLGPANYGILTALISLLYIISIPAMTLGTTMVKFVSLSKAKGDYSQIYSLFYELSRKFLVVSIIIFILFTLASKYIASFLQIPHYGLIILIGSLFLVSFLPTINNSILQAFLNFKFLVANNILWVILKIILATGLVYLGFSVGGAIVAILVSSTVTYLVSFLPLKFLWATKDKKIGKVDWLKLASFAGPVFLAILGLTSLYTTDIILVKHFFPAFEAGLYAALAVVGKIIFFASGAIVTVMFPLVSETYENGGHYRPLLVQSLSLVLVISVGITGIYFLIPALMIKILYGSSYLAASPNLGVFGIFISLYSLSNILINFFLSIRKTKVVALVLIAALSQVILISFFHASIQEVIRISILVTALLLGSLLLYYFRSEKG